LRGIPVVKGSMLVLATPSTAIDLLLEAESAILGIEVSGTGNIDYTMSAFVSHTPHVLRRRTLDLDVLAQVTAIILGAAIKVTIDVASAGLVCEIVCRLA
jgi:hypothetical protein